MSLPMYLSLAAPGFTAMRMYQMDEENEALTGAGVVHQRDNIPGQLQPMKGS